METISELYKQYQPRLVRFATNFLPTKEDAENVVQDSYLELAKRRDTIHEIDNLPGYLVRQVRNRCLDFIKHVVHEKKYESAALIEYKAKEGALDMMTDSMLMAGELQGLIQREIEKLPRRCREIFLLRRMESLTYAQIAEQLGISENTVSVQVGIALKRIRRVTDAYMR